MFLVGLLRSFSLVICYTNPSLVSTEHSYEINTRLDDHDSELKSNNTEKEKL
jgi:hypothetical protein